MAGDEILTVNDAQTGRAVSVPKFGNEMNLTAAELRREYGKALAMISEQATEIETLRRELAKTRERYEAIIRASDD